MVTCDESWFVNQLEMNLYHLKVFDNLSQIPIALSNYTKPPDSFGA